MKACAHADAATVGRRGVGTGPPTPHATARASASKDARAVAEECARVAPSPKRQRERRSTGGFFVACSACARSLALTPPLLSRCRLRLYPHSADSVRMPRLLSALPSAQAHAEPDRLLLGFPRLRASRRSSPPLHLSAFVHDFRRTTLRSAMMFLLPRCCVHPTP
eukprot:6214517-Pleurochrysis_carterae.AAC.4